MSNNIIKKAFAYFQRSYSNFDETDISVTKKSKKFKLDSAPVVTVERSIKENLSKHKFKLHSRSQQVRKSFRKSKQQVLNYTHSLERDFHLVKNKARNYESFEDNDSDQGDKNLHEISFQSNSSSFEHKSSSKTSKMPFFQKNRSSSHTPSTSANFSSSISVQNFLHKNKQIIKTNSILAAEKMVDLKDKVKKINLSDQVEKFNFEFPVKTRNLTKLSTKISSKKSERFDDVSGLTRTLTATSPITVLQPPLLTRTLTENSMPLMLESNLDNGNFNKHSRNISKSSIDSGISNTCFDETFE